MPHVKRFTSRSRVASLTSTFGDASMKLWKSFTAGIAVVLSFVVTAQAELKVGDKAPNFELKGSDGKTYKLADFAGKKAVVLAWFPKAFTGG
jgi:peroxiredoxin Q/BCP